MPTSEKKVPVKFPTGRPPRSVDRSYQFKICLWIALYKDTRQIVDLIADEFGIKFSPDNIDNNYREGKKWRKVISYLRNRYLKNISRIPIASKHYRLAVLQDALKEALIWRTKTINEHGTVQELKIGVIPQLLEQARKEVEGEKPLIDQFQHFHYTTVVQQIRQVFENDPAATVADPRGIAKDIPPLSL